TELDAIGVAVVMEATHSCMTCRGVKKPGAVMVTSAVRGMARPNSTHRTTTRR
ncbi:MAG: GTP cyclohydrolase I, partial [Planctomycetes bacterium]|nr:GTP cyclohydrolase I [Planctomycetota bacterium]